MKTIVLAQDLDLFPDQLERLRALGTVTAYKDLARDPEDWLRRVQGFDIICTGKFGLKQKLFELKNVFVSVPFVGTSWVDPEKIAANHVLIARAPGCNQDAVSEWAVGMVIALLRRFPRYVNATGLPKGVVPRPDKGASHSTITILGAGHIGLRVGKICQALGMTVSFFRRGDDLKASVKNADIVVDALGLNATTVGLLGKEFFSWLKPDAYFVSVTGSEIIDTDALIAALDANKLAGAATDCGGIQVGDIGDPYYRRLAGHPSVIATPHIAYNTTRTSRVANDMMISNIEAYLQGRPTNLV